MSKLINGTAGMPLSVIDNGDGTLTLLFEMSRGGESITATLDEVVAAVGGQQVVSDLSAKLAEANAAQVQAPASEQVTEPGT